MLSSTPFRRAGLLGALASLGLAAGCSSSGGKPTDAARGDNTLVTPEPPKDTGPTVYGVRSEPDGTRRVIPDQHLPANVQRVVVQHQDTDGNPIHPIDKAQAITVTAARMWDNVALAHYDLYRSNPNSPHAAWAKAFAGFSLSAAERIRDFGAELRATQLGGESLSPEQNRLVGGYLQLETQARAELVRAWQAQGSGQSYEDFLRGLNSRASLQPTSVNVEVTGENTRELLEGALEKLKTLAQKTEATSALSDDVRAERLAVLDTLGRILILDVEQVDQTGQVLESRVSANHRIGEAARWLTVVLDGAEKR